MGSRTGAGASASRSCSAWSDSRRSTRSAIRTNSPAASASASASRARSPWSRSSSSATSRSPRSTCRFRRRSINLLPDLQRRFGLSYLFIAHDLAVVKHIATRVAVMYLGRIVEYATSANCSRNRGIRTRRRCSRRFPCREPGRRGAGASSSQGDVPSALDPPSGCRFRTRCPHARQRCADEDPALRQPTEGTPSRATSGARSDRAPRRVLAEGAERDAAARAAAGSVSTGTRLGLGLLPALKPRRSAMRNTSRAFRIACGGRSPSPCAVAAAAQTLRIGLAEDPDILDPTLARTFVGRIVFAALCDKLFDIDEKLNIVPQLATSYQWSADSKALTLKLRQGVTFHDGEKFDAAAVKFNIERHKNMPGSNRRGELAPVHERGRDRRGHGAAQPVGAVRAAARAARRPRRHDGLAQGRAGRRRQVRRQAGVLGAVPLRRARRAGPHRRSSAIRTTGTRARSISTRSSTCRSSMPPCASPTSSRASSTSSSAWHLRRPGAQDRQPLQDLASITEIGYQGITINVGKSELAQKNPLGQGPARARSLRARARPRRHRAGGDGRRG